MFCSHLWHPNAWRTAAVILACSAPVAATAPESETREGVGPAGVVEPGDDSERDAGTRSSYYGRRVNPVCEDGAASPDYRLRVARWRTPDPDLEPLAWEGRYRQFRIRAAHGDRRLTIVPFDEAGRVTAEAGAEIARLFRNGADLDPVPVDERLVRILYVISVHFDAQEIVLVSGYRSPEADGGRTSNHHHGRAADIIVPGAPNEEVAAYAREFGHVGVGLYPVAGFVHLDVRDRAFFWTDSSGPGEPICTFGILPEVAREVDAARDPALEDPRRYAPVTMPPLPDDPDAPPEGPEHGFDDIDDEAAIGAVFAGRIAEELRAAERAARAAERRRAAREAPQSPQDDSNTGSPPTTVAAAPPGSSLPANAELRPLDTNDSGSTR